MAKTISGDRQGRKGRRPAKAKGGTSRPRSEILDPTAVPVHKLAEFLGVKQAVIKGHVTEGAPTSDRGRLNLIRYAAWLLRRTERVHRSNAPVAK